VAEGMAVVLSERSAVAVALIVVWPREWPFARAT